MYMKIKEVVSAIESFAPLSTQASFDNAGLVVGRYDDLVHSALLAVDVTEEVLDEAEKEGCDLIITHHPIMFHALKRFNSASYVERCVERAIRKGIALYACHTNLDSARDGMSWRVGEMIGLSGMRVLQPSDSDPSIGFGVVGCLPAEEEAAAFLRRVKEIFSVGAVRHNFIAGGRGIRRVAVCTGAGGSLIDDALAADADLYLTSDLRYNDFMRGERGMILADIGHFESEFCAIQILFDILSKNLCTFAVRKSVCSRNPVYYMV